MPVSDQCDMGKLRNILIVGCSGSGKSTLAKHVSQITGSRIIHLDHLYWKPDWILRGKEEIREMIAKAIEQDGWICDGNNPSSFALRAAKADVLIWLDLPRSTCLWRVLKRTTRHRGESRADLPAGCVDQFNWAFLKWVWNFDRNVRPKLEKLYQETEGRLERVRLTSSEEVDQFIEVLGKKSMGDGRVAP